MNMLELVGNLAVILAVWAASYVVIDVLTYLGTRRRQDAEFPSNHPHAVNHGEPDDEVQDHEPEHDPEDVSRNGQGDDVVRASHVRIVPPHTVTDPACVLFREPRTPAQWRRFDRHRGEACRACYTRPHPAIGSVVDRLDRWQES